MRVELRGSTQGAYASAQIRGYSFLRRIDGILEMEARMDRTSTIQFKVSYSVGTTLVTSVLLAAYGKATNSVLVAAKRGAAEQIVHVSINRGPAEPEL